MSDFPSQTPPGADSDEGKKPASVPPFVPVYPQLDLEAGSGSNPYPRLDAPPTSESLEVATGPRNYLGWLLIAIFFSVMIGGVLRGNSKGTRLNVQLNEVKSSLKTALSKDAIDRPVPSDPKNPKVENTAKPKPAPAKLSALELATELKKSETSLSKAPKSDYESAILLFQVRKELGKNPDLKTLEPLSKSDDQHIRFLARLYRNEKMQRPEAERILSKLPNKDLSTNLARVQVLEKFGDPNIRKATFNRPYEASTVGFGAFILMLLVAGVGVWTIVISKVSSGQLRPLGLPTFPMDPVMADKMALRAGILFWTYVVFGVLIQIGSDYIPALKSVGSLLIYLVVISLALFMPKDGFYGKRLTAKGLGVDFSNFWNKAGWGLGGALANLPLLALVVVVTLPLTRMLPTYSHPAGEQLTNSQSIVTTLQLFFFAVIAAPIWEEIAFRGLLFPALAKVTNNVVVGAVISSFLFAAIHPQGPGGWPVLFTIAIMNCMLTYYTKSLVPAMVLHFLNNFGALLGTLFLLPTN